MRIFILAAWIVCGLGLGPAHASQAADITGIWQYDGFFFDGHRYPNPNPNLVLKFTFFPDLTSHLIWTRTGEPGFCERKAIYNVHDDFLYQKITWINPANNADCSKDTDMQMGRETDSRFAVEPDELHLFFELNGKEFIYILRRCDSSGTTCPSGIK
jgi:hypothetical protein